MAGNDWVPIAAVVGTVGLLYAFVPGFKEQLNGIFAGGGGTAPVGAPVFTTGKRGNCSWDTKGGWCWSSTSCGGPCKTCLDNYKTTNIDSGCTAARNYFLKYASRCPKCKGGIVTGGGIGGSTCPYTGCSHIHADATACNNCRCSNFCRSQPQPAYPNIDAKGSCTCKKSLATKAYAYAGFDNVTIG